VRKSPPSRDAFRCNSEEIQSRCPPGISHNTRKGEGKETCVTDGIPNRFSPPSLYQIVHGGAARKQMESKR
jgi:hypothetical protein